jgi:hypothetical protein
MGEMRDYGRVWLRKAKLWWGVISDPCELPHYNLPLNGRQAARPTGTSHTLALSVLFAQGTSDYGMIKGRGRGRGREMRQGAEPIERGAGHSSFYMAAGKAVLRLRNCAQCVPAVLGFVCD